MIYVSYTTLRTLQPFQYIHRATHIFHICKQFLPQNLSLLPFLFSPRTLQLFYKPDNKQNQGNTNKSHKQPSKYPHPKKIISQVSHHSTRAIESHHSKSKK